MGGRRRKSLPRPMPSMKLVYVRAAGRSSRPHRPRGIVLEAEAAPEQPLLDAGDEVAEDLARRGAGLAARGEKARQGEREALLLGIDDAQLDLVAEARAQGAAQLADAVDQPVGKGAAPGEDVAVEQGLVVALEPRAAASPDDVLEAAVDVALQRLEPGDARG